MIQISLCMIVKNEEAVLARCLDSIKDLMDEMVKKGEMTVEQGKVFNEELKHNLKEKVNVTINVEKENDDLLSKLDKLTPEELDQLRRKLAEMESGDEGSGK